MKRPSAVDLRASPCDGNHILQRDFSPILKRAGLPQIRFHDLRHMAATMLLIQGIDPTIVAEMLRHATVSMTLDMYSHALPDMQRDATGRLIGYSAKIEANDDCGTAMDSHDR
jgi:integrase